MTELTTPVSSGVPAAPIPAGELLDAASEALRRAHWGSSPAVRYELAYLCVLRTGAAVLARRARPGSLPTRPHPIWGLLASAAPELAEWAQFFTVCGTHNAALVKGGARVSARQADDLIRDAATFLAIVRSMVSSTSAAADRGCRWLTSSTCTRRPATRCGTAPIRPVGWPRRRRRPGSRRWR